MLLSVIIPAYNEEDRIVRTIENTVSYLNRQNYESEIIVVSDGSTDNTKTVVETGFHPKGRVSLRVLEYQPNRGKGYAVRYGMMRGGGDILMFMDADYAVPIEYIEHGTALIQEGVDPDHSGARRAGDVRPRNRRLSRPCLRVLVADDHDALAR